MSRRNLLRLLDERQQQLLDVRSVFLFGPEFPCIHDFPLPKRLILLIIP